MTVKPKKTQQDKLDDEPGAEDRFMRGLKKALETPPKPFTPKKPGRGPLKK
jgi:hypothetical protein